MFLLSAYGECFNDWLPELYWDWSVLSFGLGLP
jgi:hypothetical protein